jgi:DNA polymerase-3 subunit delta'
MEKKMFNHIAGHDEIVAELEKQFLDERISHAYLFSGQEGIGKFTLATAFSKALLCGPENSQGQAIRVFDAGTHPDYLLIEGDKSIKVKDVLNLIDFAMSKPMLSDRKVIIVNEAEKMTIGAQNKLLKIFEEPPRYVVIILVINNIDNIIDTIRSRGYRIDFKPLSEIVIQNLLYEHVGQLSNVLEISRFSQGSFGRAMDNAQSASFAQIISFPENFFSSIIERDLLKSARMITELDNFKERVDPIIEYMLTWLRDISILKKNRNSEWILFESHREELVRQSNYFDMEMIESFIEVIREVKKFIRNHVNATVSFNYCLLKIQEAYDEHSHRSKI